MVHPSLDLFDTNSIANVCCVSCHSLPGWPPAVVPVTITSLATAADCDPYCPESIVKAASLTFQGEPDLAAALLALPNLKRFGLSNPEWYGYSKVQQSPQQQLLQSSTASEEQHSQ